MLTCIAAPVERGKRQFDKAVVDFAEAIRLKPDDPCAYEARAWIWATCPDEKLPRRQKGRRVGDKGMRTDEVERANYLQTLAAACAEIGDFESAVKWQTKANELRADDEDKTVGESRLKLYQEKKPYRDDNPSDPFLLDIAKANPLRSSHVTRCWWPGSAACRGRRTGNPVRIRNGPAAVTERQRVLPLFCHCWSDRDPVRPMRRLDTPARKSEDLPARF